MPNDASIHLVFLRHRAGQWRAIVAVSIPCEFGSGTYSTISSNSVQSHSFRQGDMLWIVDESENGVASASIGAGTRELEIGSSCTSINAR